ncbi:hypothetical protein TEU_01405 [Thermococcus eurythermalis]|uniref:DUF3213 domain-containing protein n=1 Tax=Thermococcus eurythermalis TaxID=1505907 RepID=A0A097QRJ9_9EURY|nr:DUF3213 domain-containing protein [Thermococcus eurythermalis]AIU69099.1 hypothetical protein TEU_01405 [Thermococcus eurythermalis]
MSVSPEKKLTKITLKFENVDWEKATAKQYELLTDVRVWRAFINGYSKKGIVVFDEEKMPKKELIEKLEDLKPEIVKEEQITVEELLESSYSWNNVLSNA